MRIFWTQWLLTLLALLGCSAARSQSATNRAVQFSNADQSIRFGGTLSYPTGETSVPAVMLVSGTGPQDRDGTMGGFKLFAQLATYLNRRGVAVLRLDDRGVGQTTGVYGKATTNDFANDVRAALTFLKQQPRIDPKKIGLLGHSEGGAVISIVAANNPDVAFVVSLAGLATKGLDGLISQNRNLVAAAPIPDYNRKRYNEINELMFRTVLQHVEADSAQLAGALNKAYSNWVQEDTVRFRALNVGMDYFRFPLYSYVMQATSPWYRYHIQYDPARYLPHIKAPVLAINGEKDPMVPARENLANWQTLVTAGGNHDVTTQVVSSVGHLLLPCQTCTPQEPLPQLRALSPDLLSLIGDWITARTR